MRIVGDRVLIEKVEEKYVSKGNLHLPDVVSNNRGVIKLLGAGPVVDQLEVGQTVVFDKAATIELPEGFILNGFDIIAVL